MLILENVKVHFEVLSNVALSNSVAPYRVHSIKKLQKYLSHCIPFFLRNEFRCRLTSCLCTWIKSAMYVFIISCQFIQNLCVWFWTKLNDSPPTRPILPICLCFQVLLFYIPLIKRKHMLTATFSHQNILYSVPHKCDILF